MNESPNDGLGSTTPPMPGERRLAHPPSDRYRTTENAVDAGPGAANPVAQSAGRGLAAAGAAGMVGAAAITVLGGVLAISAGLLVVAAATGWAVAIGFRFGAADHVDASRRVRLAVGLTIGAIALGQLGLWLYARTEGGVLGPLDYLGETFGPLVPLEFVIGAIVGRWSSR